MKRSEKLLKEIVPGEDMGDFQRASLDFGLSCMRRERRRRNLVRASVFAVVLAMVTAALFVKSNRAIRSGGANIQVATVPSPAISEHVEFISDEQLLALFPDRPVALIGKPGEQRLVFLDESKSDPARAQF